MDRYLINQAEGEMTKIKIEMMMNTDLLFFSNVYFNLKHSWVDTHPTACTDGLNVKFNPEFFMSLKNRPERLFLVIHEVYHVAFQHMFRLGDRDHQKWVQACDYVVNSMLIDQGYQMPECGLYDPQYRGMAVEDVYDLLPDEPDDGGTTGFGMDMEEPETSEDPITKQEQLESIQKEIENVLVKSALQAQLSNPDKTIGNIPSEMQIILNKLMKPKVPWNKLLRRYYFAASKSDYTLRKPNRRFMPDYHLPSLYSDGLNQVGIAVDASSSVPDDYFSQFITEVGSMLSKEKPDLIKFLQFNTDIISENKITTLNNLNKLNFRGRGGTRIDPVIEWTRENKPDVMIIFTDGYFYLTEPNPKVPVLWLIYNNPGFTAPYGKVIHYEVD